jgi:hypothetical protein
MLFHLRRDVFDTTPSTTETRHIQIQQRDVRDLEATEQPPEVIDMATT